MSGDRVAHAMECQVLHAWLQDHAKDFSAHKDSEPFKRAQRVRDRYEALVMEIVK